MVGGCSQCYQSGGQVNNDNDDRSSWWWWWCLPNFYGWWEFWQGYYLSYLVRGNATPTQVRHSARCQILPRRPVGPPNFLCNIHCFKLSTSIVLAWESLIGRQKGLNDLSSVTPVQIQAMCPVPTILVQCYALVGCPFWLLHMRVKVLRFEGCCNVLFATGKLWRADWDIPILTYWWQL